MTTVTPGAEPVAYLYTRDDGSKDLLLSCNGEYARNLLEAGATETPLYATPQAQTAVVEAWQPIESAPRDGTRFLAWCPYVGRAIMRIHGLHRETWAIDPSGKLGCQPTHWMKLPEPPHD